MTIKLSTKAGGGQPKLAPQLTFPIDKEAGTSTTVRVDGIDATGSLTTILSLTGKFIISFLSMGTLTVDDIVTVKLTIDGIVIWDTPSSSNSSTELYIGQTTPTVPEKIQCDSTFLFEMETAVDTSIRLTYLARPIL